MEIHIILNYFNGIYATRIALSAIKLQICNPELQGQCDSATAVNYTSFHINHTSPSRNKLERKPMKVPTQHHQSIALANHEPNLLIASRNKLSREPLRRVEECNLWQRNSETPCPWQKPPWRVKIQSQREATRRMNLRFVSTTDRAAWIPWAFERFQCHDQVQRFLWDRTLSKHHSSQ